MGDTSFSRRSHFLDRFRNPMNRAQFHLAALLALAPVAAAAQAGVPAGASVLRPGDHVTLEVFRNRDMSGTFTVTPDSTLLHPVYGAVKVAGVPIPVAESRIRDVLRRYEADPQFSFGPEYRVFVGGLVREQNQFFLPEVSVAQAISRAGGSTAPDKRYRLRFVRDNTLTVLAMTDPRITDLLQQPIRSGDQIVIEERPTFRRAYLDPALLVVQTLGSVISTFVIVRTVFKEDKTGTTTTESSK